MQNVGEIQMFRLKPLKSSTIPQKWAVVFFSEKSTQVQFSSYRDGNWIDGSPVEGDTVGLEYIASVARTKEITWVVGEGVYAWLCQQGLYQQIVDGIASLPLGNSSSNAGKLSGQFATGDPCIVDIVVNGKRLHLVDFSQFGVHYVSSVNDGVAKLKDYIRMVVELEMGTFKSTAAAQGGARFRTYDMGQHKIYCHQMPEVRKLERDAFYGGRAEALTLGHIADPVYDFDAVSMHPTIGLTEKFPTKLIDFCSTPTRESPLCRRDALLKHYRADKHIIARVRLRTPSADYPVRMRLPGGGEREWTIYPIGEFDTCLCHPEFSHALQRDRIMDVKFWAAYDCEPIFRENSEWFFDAKERLLGLGLGHMKGSLKLVQNSLYGNLGRRGRCWIDTTKWHDADWGMWWGRHPDVGNVVAHRAVYGVHQYLDSGLEPENSCPAISATMFSYSRMRLLGMIEMAGRENTHYYDTDGLAVNSDGRIRMQDTHENVKLKWQSSDVDIRGIKYYRRDDVWTHAGVPEWAERHPDGSATFQKHEPFNFGMWHNQPFAHKFIVARNDPHPVYRHGIVGRNGRVSPFVLPFRSC